MKLHHAPLVIALSLIACAAHAGRDESLIQQTRKNQLAYDAMVRKQEQEQKQQVAAAQPQSAAQAAPEPAAAAAGQH
jgi:hypothetical protein